MIGRALDSNNDLILENGTFKLVRDGAETVQHVRSRLLFYKGEWFLDINAGTPWFQEILIKPANLNNTESIIKSRILQTPGVLRLLSFKMEELNVDTRRVRATFSAETLYGILEGVTINV